MLNARLLKVQGSPGKWLLKPTPIRPVLEEVQKEQETVRNRLDNVERQ